MSDTDHSEQTALLREAKQQALALEAEDFCTRYDGFHLLGALPAEPDDEWSFTTGVHAIVDLPGRRRHGRRSFQESLSEGNGLLWKVEKSDRNGWARRISVGRATNNDIVIRHPSVSKLHAHFHFGTLVRLRVATSARLLLEDVGSANGTSVNNRPLVEGEPTAVDSGTRLAFGEIRCELLDARTLYVTLRSTLL